MDEVQRLWRAQRQDQVQKYLEGIENRQLAAKVFDACARDFADLRINVHV